MAKIGSWFRQISIEAFIEIVKLFWPAIFPVLAMIGQWFSFVPWPYFFAAFSATTAFAIWTIRQISKWKKKKTIAERIHIYPSKLRQGIWVENPETCTYKLILEVLNADSNALYLRINSFKWNIGNKSVSDPVIEVPQLMLAPGVQHLGGPSIDDLDPGPHKGKFRVCVGIGKEFGVELYTKELAGSFDALEMTKTPAQSSLPISVKFSQVTNKKIRA